MNEQETKTAVKTTSPKSMRHFVVAWTGQLISMLGSGLTSFGLIVWLYERTHAATPFAVAFLTATLPSILFAPVAGHLADRKNRKLIVLLADSGDALITLAILLLVLTGRLDTWMVYIITFLSATCQTFQDCAWSAAVPTIVPKAELGRANGMASMSSALSSLLPPVLAGLLFTRIGFVGLVAIDAITYLAALSGILAIDIPRVAVVEEASGKASVLSDALFGFRYLLSKKGLFGLVLYFAFVNFCLNFAYVLLGPMIIPSEGSAGLGFVQSLFGLGALAGGFVAAAWGGPKKDKVKFLILCIGGSAIGVTVAGLRPGLLWPAVGLFVMLFAIQVSSVSQSLFQTKIEAGAQGRTKAARSMLATSLMPLAFLSAGPLADNVFGPALMPGGSLASTVVGRLCGVGKGRGEGLLFVVAGVALLVVTIAVYLSPSTRNIESRLPDVVESDVA